MKKKVKKPKFKLIKKVAKAYSKRIPAIKSTAKALGKSAMAARPTMVMGTRGVGKSDRLKTRKYKRMKVRKDVFTF